MTEETAGQLLARVLSAAGIGAAYGRPFSGLPVRDVTDPAVALLLAHAHRAVHITPAVAHLGEGTVVVAGTSPEASADAGAPPPLPEARLVVKDTAALAAAVPAVARRAGGASCWCWTSTSKPRSPRPRPLGPPTAADGGREPDDDVLADVAAADRIVVLAGPGVVAQRAVGDLHALAAAGRLGVLNTWGAKGLFHWQSPHHWATVGLQELDFELGGLGGADLVLAVGIDEREAPPAVERVSAPRSLARQPSAPSPPVGAVPRRRSATCPRCGRSSPR